MAQVMSRMGPKSWQQKCLLARRLSTTKLQESSQNIDKPYRQFDMLAHSSRAIKKKLLNGWVIVPGYTLKIAQAETVTVQSGIMKNDLAKKKCTTDDLDCRGRYVRNHVKCRVRGLQTGNKRCSAGPT